MSGTGGTAKRVDQGSVTLTVPGRAEYLRLVRLAAADAGTRADLSIEDVEDLRIAVDELTYALVGDEPVDEVLTLTYTAAPGLVEIEGSIPATGASVAVSDLRQSITSAVVDDHEIVDDGVSRRFRFTKRSRL
jgi:serine/threonine-protein kinase RsbW